MAAKDSEKKQWTDPKDYGLPFVEITPIRTKVQEPEVNSVSAKAGKKSEPITEPAQVAAEVHSSKSDQTGQKEEKKPETKAQAAPVAAPMPQKKSTTWAWVAMLIGLGIVSVLVWQILSQSNASERAESAPTSESIPSESPAQEPENTAESTPSDQNQAIVNQDSITPINNSNPNISNPAQTGTTIANTAVGNLIRVESKAERPQYFIIVGSLPNEKQASEEAKVYFGRSSTMYLILPYEEATNYRLAIGKFGSFKSAAEELDRIKSNYSEELWILKY